MHGTTVSHGFCASDSGAMSRRSFRGQPVDWGNAGELLERLLIANWTLSTGRTLRAGVTAKSRSADEPIGLRADDQTAIP